MKLLWLFLVWSFVAWSEPLDPKDPETHFGKDPVRDLAVCKPESREALLALRAKLESGQPLTDDDREAFKKLAADVPKSCLTDDQKKDLESLFARYGVLPCDPAKLKKPITVQLVPEQHRNCARCLAKKKEVAKEAQSGRYLLISENRALAGSRPDRVRYIDNVFANGFSDLAMQRWDLIVNLHKKEPPERLWESMEQILGVVREVPEIRKHWDDVKKDDWYVKNKDIGPVTKIVDAMIATGKTDGDVVDKATKEALLKDPDKFVQWAGFTIFALSHVARKPENHFHLLSPNLDSLFHFSLNPRPIGSWPKVQKEVLVEWRNHLFTQNIAKLVCEAGLSGENVVAHMGAHHVPGVYAELMEVLKRSGAKGIKVSVFTQYRDHRHHLDDLKAGDPAAVELDKFFRSLPP